MDIEMTKSWTDNLVLVAWGADAYYGAKGYRGRDMMQGFLKGTSAKELFKSLCFQSGALIVTCNSFDLSFHAIGLICLLNNWFDLSF